VREVLIPPYPGISSATGLLTTDIKYDRLATQFAVQSDVSLEGLNADFDRLEAGIRGQLAADGIAPGGVVIERAVDCRYAGQGYELRIEVPDGPIGPAELEAVWRAMHERHRAEYGHAFADNPIELVNVRVTGVGATPRLTGLPLTGDRDLEHARIGEAPVGFRRNGSVEAMPTGFYRRSLLPVGERVAGPAVILQADSTTLLVPGSTGRLDEAGNLLISLEG
jgi:N-methylhydantoinase A